MTTGTDEKRPTAGNLKALFKNSAWLKTLRGRLGLGNSLDALEENRGGTGGIRLYNVDQIKFMKGITKVSASVDSSHASVFSDNKMLTNIKTAVQRGSNVYGVLPDISFSATTGDASTGKMNIGFSVVKVNGDGVATTIRSPTVEISGNSKVAEYNIQDSMKKYQISKHEFSNDKVEWDISYDFYTGHSDHRVGVLKLSVTEDDACTLESMGSIAPEIRYQSSINYLVSYPGFDAATGSYYLIVVISNSSADVYAVRFTSDKAGTNSTLNSNYTSYRIAPIITEGTDVEAVIGSGQSIFIRKSDLTIFKSSNLFKFDDYYYYASPKSRIRRYVKDGAAYEDEYDRSGNVTSSTKLAGPIVDPLSGESLPKAFTGLFKLSDETSVLVSGLKVILFDSDASGVSRTYTGTITNPSGSKDAFGNMPYISDSHELNGNTHIFKDFSTYGYVTYSVTIEEN